MFYVRLVCQLSPRTDRLTPSNTRTHMLLWNRIYNRSMLCISFNSFLFEMYDIACWRSCVCVVWTNSSIYSTTIYFDIFHSFCRQPVKNGCFNQTDHTHTFTTQTKSNKTLHKKVCVMFYSNLLFTIVFVFLEHSWQSVWNVLDLHITRHINSMFRIFIVVCTLVQLNSYFIFSLQEHGVEFQQPNNSSGIVHPKIDVFFIIYSPLCHF